MALDTQDGMMTYDAPQKDLYEMGEIPPMGYVPKQMYAWAIRILRCSRRWSMSPHSTATKCWFS